MSTFFSAVANASFPVAVGLLICAAIARGVLWAEVDDAPAQRLSRQYLEPLSTWSLIALATHIVAWIAAGDGNLVWLVLPLGLGVVAALLRSAGEAEERAQVEPEAQPLAASAPTPAPAPAPSGHLWARQPGEAR